MDSEKKYSYKISCVIPTYNVAEYLEECVLSVVNQTLKGIEIIIMDDGSTDSCPTIGKMLAEEHENVFYYHKENGGLGQARNYAIPYVHGEYLIFLDSDDMVPADAYEKMYNKAKETGVDMVIGAVRRFNSKGQWKSDLQTRAIRRAQDRTSILETPELIYDTTSWNKLIRTEFYLANNFKFPEGILYEDIPVTIPMHHLANGVAVLEDLVYLWRTREGGNKSITQDRNSIPNLMDRLTVMKMLNRFYEEHVTDERAIFEKDYKWLTLDLRLYVQQFSNATDEYITLAMEEMRGFLENISPKVLAAIPAIDRMKYELIRRNDKDTLIKLLDYEKNAYWEVKSKKKKVDGKIHFVMNRRFGNFDDSYYDLTPEFERADIFQRINDNYWSGNCYVIEGFAGIKRLGNMFPGKMKLSAGLVNTRTGEKVPVFVQNTTAKGVRGTYGFGVNRANYHFSYTSYLGDGYRITIDFSKPEVQAICHDTLKVQVHFELGEVSRDFFVGTPRVIDKKVISPRNLPEYRLIDGVKVVTDYVGSYDLVLHTDHDLITLQSFDVEEEGVKLIGSRKEEYLIPRDADASVFCPTLDGAHFSSNELRLADYVETKDKSGFVKLICDENGLLKVAKKNYAPKLKSLNKKGNVLELVLHCPEIETEGKNIAFYLKGKDNRRTTQEFAAEALGKDSFRVRIDLGNEKIAEQFCKDFWLAFLRVDDIVYPVYGDSAKKPERFGLKNFYYEFPASEQLVLQTSVKWHWYENSWRRRLVQEKIVYPILRKILPIHKKTMVFESYWGGKYDCNPKGFYEFMQREHPEYKCIWSFVDERTPIEGNAIRVRRKSLKYHYYMATSQYFMDNVNFDGSFRKKKGQIVFQTMHGTPMKTLGLDVPGDFATEKGRQDFITRCKRWDYLIVQSDRVAEITKSCFAFTKTHLRTGYPRNDKVFAGNTPENIRALKEKMGLPLDKKLVLYAPTWRIKNQFNLNMDIERMKAELGNDIVIMLRIHPFAAPGLDPELLDEFIVNMTSYPGIEDLYLVSDLVITDYSSVMFDFAVLNKPMYFYTYDLEDYRDKLRGFYFDFDKEVPGPILKNFDELLDALKNMDRVTKQYDGKLQEFRKSFCEYEDGNACRKIFETAFH